jgi:hypothetical protein
MVLMLRSSVHSIGSQMHNGRADLLFPTTPTRAGNHPLWMGRGASARLSSSSDWPRSGQFSSSDWPRSGQFRLHHRRDILS